MMNKLYAWIVSTKGATGIEYGLIAAGISSVAGVSAMFMGDDLGNMFRIFSDMDLAPAAEVSQ